MLAGGALEDEELEAGGLLLGAPFTHSVLALFHRVLCRWAVPVDGAQLVERCLDDQWWQWPGGVSAP